MRMPETESFFLRGLPFPSDALSPAFGCGSIEAHYGQICRAHLDAMRIFRASYAELSSMSVRRILTGRALPRRDADAILWHAGALYAHELYFSSLTATPGGYPHPRRELAELISHDVGSFAELAYRLGEAAVGMRGVGFVYLLLGASGRLVIRSYRDYDCPMLAKETPLFCIDLWEHAYYTDHGAHPERAVDAFLSVLSWRAVEKRIYDK